MNKHRIRQGTQTDPVAIMNDVWLCYFALDPQDQATEKSKRIFLLMMKQELKR